MLSRFDKRCNIGTISLADQNSKHCKLKWIQNFKLKLRNVVVFFNRTIAPLDLSGLEMDPASSGLPPIFVDGKALEGLDGLGETLATAIATAAANANGANLNLSSDTLG